MVGFAPLQAPPLECTEGLALEYAMRESWRNPEQSGIDTFLTIHTCTQLLGTSTQCTCSWRGTRWLSPVACGESSGTFWREITLRPVSYTHLTLPTICSV